MASGPDLRRLRGLLRLLRAEGVTEYSETDIGITIKLADDSPSAAAARAAQGIPQNAEAAGQQRQTFMSGPYGELERELWPNGAPFGKPEARE